MAEVFTKVYKETNYKVFKSLSGNRDVTDARVGRIKESIRKVGYIPSPILVNEKMEVIDGQGRLEACKELGLPIYYVIQPGIGIDECIAMNINQINWKPIDYVRSYAEQGKQSYQYLKALSDQFPEFGIAFIAAVTSESITTTGRNTALSNGNYKCTEETYSNTIVKLEWLKGWLDLIRSIGGKAEPWEYALSFCYDVDTLDRDELKKKCVKNSSVLMSAGTPVDAIQQLENLYNLGKRKDKRVQLLIKYAGKVADSSHVCRSRSYIQRAIVRKTLESAT